MAVVWFPSEPLVDCVLLSSRAVHVGFPAPYVLLGAWTFSLVHKAADHEDGPGGSALYLHSGERGVKRLGATGGVVSAWLLHGPRSSFSAAYACIHCQTCLQI